MKQESQSSSFTVRTKGTPLSITVGKTVEKQAVFSNEFSKQLQMERHFSDITNLLDFTICTFKSN